MYFQAESTFIEDVLNQDSKAPVRLVKVMSTLNLELYVYMFPTKLRDLTLKANDFVKIEKVKVTSNQQLANDVSIHRLFGPSAMHLVAMTYQKFLSLQIIMWIHC